MIVVLFKVMCRPERLEDALKAFAQVVAPSRAVDGVISFDIDQDLVSPDTRSSQPRCLRIEQRWTGRRRCSRWGASWSCSPR
jgi:quinol monooxygenase YgiN